MYSLDLMRTCSSTLTLPMNDFKMTFEPYFSITELLATANNWRAFNKEHSLGCMFPKT